MSQEILFFFEFFQSFKNSSQAMQKQVEYKIWPSVNYADPGLEYGF